MQRTWLSPVSQQREAAIDESTAAASTNVVRERIEELIVDNAVIHEQDCINLNPASNAMSPRAEAALARGLSSRASLGHAGEKYEMGLEAVESLEVITANLARQVFEADFAEIRVGSGALANLYAFMSTCQAGDAIIVPPASVGGHVTHNTAGAAGLFGLEIHEAPIDPQRYSVDPVGVLELAKQVRPKMITVGASLNLVPHPVAELREVADEVGATLLFDAAHACGLFAGRAWANPLAEGAHLMTMSTYKSLAGPAGGLLVTNDAALAERVDAIAYPGLTANFDAGRTTALALTLLDWIDQGPAWIDEMISSAQVMAGSLAGRGVAVFETGQGATLSHQFALACDDGEALAKRLRLANLLTCPIGLPTGSGLRLGTPEAVRWGMTRDDMPAIAGFIADAMTADPATVAPQVAAFRRAFNTIHFAH